MTRRWNTQVAFSQAMEHIATWTRIEIAQMEAVAAAMRVNQAATAFVLDNVHPTTAGRSLVFKAALGQAMPRDDAKVLDRTWQKAVAPVGHVRQRLAHWVWVAFTVEDRLEGYFLLPPAFFLISGAYRREHKKPVKVAQAGTLSATRSMANGVELSIPLLRGLVREARSAEITAELICDAVERSVAAGGLPPKQRQELLARQERPPLRRHRTLLEPPPQSRGATPRRPR